MGIDGYRQRHRQGHDDRNRVGEAHTERTHAHAHTALLTQIAIDADTEMPVYINLDRLHIGAAH
jgi:hypothetical protein